VTGCPALTPINTSLKKRRDELQEGGEVIVIQDYEGTFILNTSFKINTAIFDKIF